MTTLEKITLGIAAWGAVLATVSFIWNLMRDVIHLGKLKVYCYKAIIAGPGEYEEGDYVVYKVINFGKEPIVVSSFGGVPANDKGKVFIIPPEVKNISKKLEPGDELLQLTKYEFMSELIENGIKSLHVTDSLNRRFQCSKRDLRKLTKKT